MVHRKGGFGMAGHIIIFEHIDFRGGHRHIINEDSNLNHPEDRSMNDKMSSFVILEGRWQFFRHAGFQIPYANVLGPGTYRWVGDHGIENDQVSSLRSV
jgi:hypothetical protein